MRILQGISLPAGMAVAQILIPVAIAITGGAVPGSTVKNMAVLVHGAATGNPGRRLRDMESLRVLGSRFGAEGGGKIHVQRAVGRITEGNAGIPVEYPGHLGDRGEDVGRHRIDVPSVRSGLKTTITKVYRAAGDGEGII